MQDPSVRERGHRIARQDEIHQARLRAQITLVGGAVGVLDARVADHVGQRPAECGIGPGGRRPAQMSDVAAGGRDIVCKALQADIDHLEVLLE